jgi:hypothetical protein
MKKNLIITKFKYTMLPYKDEGIMKLGKFIKNLNKKNNNDRSYNKISNEYMSDDENNNDGFRS